MYTLIVQYLEELDIVAEDEDSKKAPNRDSSSRDNKSLSSMGGFLDRLRHFREMFRDVPPKSQQENQDRDQVSKPVRNDKVMTPGYEQSKQKQGEGEIDQLIAKVRNIMVSPSPTNDDNRPKKK